MTILFQLILLDFELEAASCNCYCCLLISLLFSLLEPATGYIRVDEPEGFMKLLSAGFSFL